MSQHLYNRLSREQIITILERYCSGEITSRDAWEKLSLKKARFFKLLKAYREQGDSFQVRGERKEAPRRITKDAEKHILAELEKDKELIDNKDIAIRSYNYSAIRDTLKEKHSITVSVPTIITRAKDNDYYLLKKERRIHDLGGIGHCPEGQHANRPHQSPNRKNRRNPAATKTRESSRCSYAGCTTPTILV